MHPTRPTRFPPRDRGAAARSRLSVSLLAVLVFVVTGTGCAANHAFPEAAPAESRDLARALEAKPEAEDALFDLTYWPLLHLELQTFTERKASEHPEGYELLSVRSWLPFFVIVDGKVERFDTEHVGYEESAFEAVLWGLWARHQTTIQTLHGARVARTGRILWFVDWEDSVSYAQP
ncbi:MAG: hypothetical protein AAF430_01165 [Myxococcota bacterium]